VAAPLAVGVELIAFAEVADRSDRDCLLSLARAPRSHDCWFFGDGGFGCLPGGAAIDAVTSRRVETNPVHLT
jgi:hypothetical protein